MNDDKPCPDCGEMHEEFSGTMLEIYQAVKEAVDPEDRQMLMVALAEEFAAHHDLTDSDLLDEFHQYVEEFHAAQLAYNQKAVRLGRMALQIMEHYMDAKSMLAKTDKTVN